MELIRAELDGLYGAEVLRDMEEINSLYGWYEGTEPRRDDISLLDYEPTAKKTNIIKKLIKDEARFLFGKPPEFVVKCGDMDAAGKIQAQLNKLLSDNLFSERIIKAARDCFVGKRVALKLLKKVDGRVKINFRPAQEFVFDTLDDDVNTMTKVIFFYRINDKDNKNEQRLWKQRYRLENGRCLLDEGVYNGAGELVEDIQTDFDTGLDFIPVKIVFNDGMSGDLKGESDVAGLIDLQRAYDAMTSDDIDALKFNMFPQTVAINVDGKSLEHMVIAPGALVDVQFDPAVADGQKASLSKLESSFSYDARLENALNRIKSEMYELLSVPDVSSEQLRGFVTSGKSMKALYWQLVTRCEEKFTAWRNALEWMCFTALKMSEIDVPDDTTITVENIYPLMEDEFEEKSLDITAVNAQVMSRKAYIKKWGKDVDDEQADSELEQIQLERQMLEDSYTGDLTIGDE